MAKKTIKKESKPTCGIIIPISKIDNCTPEHWSDVLGIIKDVCEINDFIPNLVSDADDVGIIHKRIVENIYSSDIVICDVSCKNANVMFELGMRLAFDKPTIIIKDEITGYSFDTSLIEHLEYPRDLRFTTITKFKQKLGEKINATYKKSKEDKNYSTFLKHFGKYKIAHLDDKEITSDRYIIDAIEDLKRDVRVIRNQSHRNIMTNRNDLLFEETDNRVSSRKKSLFKSIVQRYLSENNIPILRPKEMSIEIDNIIDDLEKNEVLRDIAGSPKMFRNLVEESIY